MEKPMKSLKKFGLIAVFSLCASQGACAIEPGLCSRFLSRCASMVSKDNLAAVGSCIKRNPWKTAGVIFVGILACNLFYDLKIKKQTKKPQATKK
jgi:hypothetical protein